MKKIFFTIFFLFLLCVKGFGDSYYFKNCNISEEHVANYLIDLKNKLINVTFVNKNDESVQTWADEIQKVKKDQITSKKIPSKSGKNYYFQYYLNASSKTITRQKYIKQNDFYKLDGPVIETFCLNVKADWNQNKKIEEKSEVEKNLELEKKKKELEKNKRKEELELKKKRKKEIDKKNDEKQYNISIVSKKWIKLSKYGPDSKKQLKKKFDQKAAELCSITGNFKILEKKVEIIEMDDTPAFGLETVIKLGIKGVVECI